MATTLGTSVTTAGILTVNSTAGIVTGSAIQIKDTPFGGLTANTTYFAIGTTALTISLSLSPGGSPLAIAGGSGSAVVISGVTATTVTNAGVLTVGSTTGFVVGRSARLFGTPFGGLIANSTYYIRAVASTTVSLSLTPGGAALSISGGTGNMVINAGPPIGPGVGNIVTTGVSSGATDPRFGDYNTIQYIVAKVMGPPTDGDPRYGYNQLLSSSQVALGDKITLSHWLNLRDDMVRARGHQSGSSSESNNISLPTVLSKVTEATRKEFYDYATTLTTYRDYIGAGQWDPLTMNTAKRTSVWRGNIQSIVSVNFGSVPAARAYFNAGGVVKFSCTLDGTFAAASADKDNTWSTMFGSMGTVTMDRTSVFLATGSTGTTYSLGFFNLQTTDQLIFRKSAPTGSYTNNVFEIYARTSGGNLTFTLYYKDLDEGLLTPAGLPRATGQYVEGIDEYVDGILKQETVLWKPSGSYVSVPTPTVTQSGDLQDATGAVYGLWADKYEVDEGSSVSIKLRTLNVANGIIVPWTITGTGVTASRFTSNTLTGYFTVIDNAAAVGLTLVNNLYTDGPTTLTLTLNNGTAVINIEINDTSTTPTGIRKFESVGASLPWVAPPGVRTVSVLIIGGGGGGGRKGGGGGGAGQVRILNTATAPGNTYYITVGQGGASNALGYNSVFNGNTAYGGNPGYAGDSTGHAGTHTGGSGGPNGDNTRSGGTGAGSTGTVQRIAGGGGAGSSGNGFNGDGALNLGGRGGIGQSISFYGEAPIFVGGGGGGGAGRQGGFGGGSNSQGGTGYGGASGGSANNAGGNGAANTGGGGGGGGANSEGTQLDAVLVGYDGGNGGSGLVWIGWP